jgi:hypothetical protein
MFVMPALFRGWRLTVLTITGWAKRPPTTAFNRLPLSITTADASLPLTEQLTKLRLTLGAYLTP